MSPLYLAIVLVIAIAFIIYACAVAKWHPLVVLLVAAMGVGLFTGMPARQTLDTILSGGGQVFASIGLLIVFGTMLGEILERTGAAGALANRILGKANGEQLPYLTHIMGLLVGIPVFCDAGFILLSRLVNALPATVASSSTTLQTSLATGLYTSHIMLPPTPGPMAVAGNLGLENQLGWVILLGLLVILPTSLVSVSVLRYLGRKQPPLQKVALETVATPLNNNLPVYKALLPLLLPLLLITGGSVWSMVAPDNQSSITAWMSWLGHPVPALAISILLALFLLGRPNQQDWGAWFQQALIQSGPIILITTAGGAFGAVLKATPLQAMIEQQMQLQALPIWGIYPLAFLVSAVLKTAQGSSTAAMIVSAALLLPVISAFNLSVPHQALVVLAIGAGAMVVSHANDSYFWVIKQYGKIELNQLYRSYTVVTGVMGVCSLATIMLLYYLFR